MIWLLNSAVLPAREYGTYEYSPATADDLAAILRGEASVCDGCGDVVTDHSIGYHLAHSHIECACGGTFGSVVPPSLALPPSMQSVTSRIGYDSTADAIEEWTGVRPEVSREAYTMQPGDVAYIVRLHWEIARIWRKS